jgi:hypothetical protein
MVEIFAVGAILGLWLGYLSGYRAAVRKNGWDGMRTGFRRWRTSRW